MPLGTFVAGRASATYDPPGATAATDLGIMREGYTVSWSVGAEPINETDAFGVQFIDGVFRGLTDVTIDCVAIEYKAGPLLVASFFGALAPTGASFLGPGVVGRLHSDMAGVLVLTASAGTPAVASPATMTVTKAILHEGVPVSLLTNSKLKTIPLKMRALLYDDSGVFKYLTTT